MRANRRLLRAPSDAAVCGLDDSAVSSYSPPVRSVIWSERDAVEMIFNIRGSKLPPVPTIRCCQDNAARSRSNGAPFIKDRKTIERRRRRRFLSVPCKASVLRAENCAVRANGPAVKFVLIKAYRIYRVALGARVLP